MARTTTDMTRGNVLGHLLKFALPVFLGMLLQRFYAAVDAWVVGNYATKADYAAIGAVTPVINTIISLASGFSVGAGVVVSQAFGAKHDERIHHSVHTAVMLAAIVGFAAAVIGVVFTPTMLRMMHTPDEIFKEASRYLFIVLGGSFFTVLYNTASGIINAIGDSRRPFYFLVVSSVINIVLDLVLVRIYHWGVVGVAVATVFAQVVSVVLAYLVLLRAKDATHLYLRDIRLYEGETKRIVSLAIPISVQNAVTSFSNIFVQTYINAFGTDIIGGYTGHARIDGFATLPLEAISSAIATFSGQNVGARNVARVREGLRKGTVLTVVITTAVVALLWTFARPLAAFFCNDPGILNWTVVLVRLMSPFYILYSVGPACSATMRGCGETRIQTIYTIFSFVVFRQIYLFIISRAMPNQPIPIVLGYPLGWMLYGALAVIVYFRLRKRLFAQVENGNADY